MKVEELEKIIESKVRKVFREELREILVEAVEAIEGKNVVVEPKAVKQQLKPKEDIFSVGNILRETYQGMSKVDYKNLTENHVLADKPTVGTQMIEESSELPSFIANAKAIFDASNEIDKRRHAV